MIPIARKVVPSALKRVISRGRKLWRSTPAGRADFGDLRRLTPLDDHYGYGRGTPIDRFYIDRFLQENAGCVSGRVLEVKDDHYTRRLGGRRVTKSDIVDIDDMNSNATIVADLANPGDSMPSNAYDCVIFTQTLQLIYDAPAAVRSIHRSLKPGGIVLATFPGLCRIGRDELPFWCWTFTELSARKMFGEFFPDDGIETEASGNVLAATAFLQGVSVEELTPEELEYRDPGFSVCVTLKARKSDLEGSV